jgi:hypothetical protein
MARLDFTVRVPPVRTLPVNYNLLTSDERREVREQYAKQQNGLCCHCQHPLLGNPSPEVQAKPVDKGLFPTGFFQWPQHLHHNHKSGLTIGTVHARCNAVLWQYHGE